MARRRYRAKGPVPVADPFIFNPFSCPNAFSARWRQAVQASLAIQRDRLPTPVLCVQSLSSALPVGLITIFSRASQMAVARSLPWVLLMRVIW